MTKFSINAQALNEAINPLELLSLIGYPKSKPKNSNGEIRDYCPIHGSDKQQSLAINPQKKCFTCHSCGTSGSLIDLYGLAMKYDMNQDFHTVLKELAKEFSYKDTFFEINMSKTEATTKHSSTQQKEALPNLSNILEQFPLQGTSPYALKKKIKVYPGVRYGKDEKGNSALVIGMGHAEDPEKISCINYVKEGAKPFHTGSKKSGSFFLLGCLENASEIYFCEGYATAATIYEALGEIIPVAMVGSKDNIACVANAMHRKYPKLKRIIALDLGAEKELEKIEKEFFVTKPNFEGMEWEGKGERPKEGEKKKPPNDFNDLVSMCGKSLGVVKEQLNDRELLPDKSTEEQLGAIIGKGQAQKLRARSYNDFEKEHKNLLNLSGLVTGYTELDQKMKVCNGDFITVQGISGHGKTTLMMQLALRYLIREENKNCNPMCVFITYESMPVRVEQKLLNMISNEIGEGILLKFTPDNQGYHYPQNDDFPHTKALFNTLYEENRFQVLMKVPYQAIGKLISHYRQQFSNRTILFVLDYIQKVDHNLKGDGWQIMKELAYGLESLAIENEVIIIAGSQVNRDRQSREGADIFNASTHNIDIFNHSHTTIKNHKDLATHYLEKEADQSICSLAVRKQKYGPEFELEKYLLLNGYRFQVKPTHKNLNRGNIDDLY